MKNHRFRFADRLTSVAMAVVAASYLLFMPFLYAQNKDRVDFLSKIKSRSTVSEEQHKQVLRDVAQFLAGLNTLDRLSDKDQEGLDTVLAKIDKTKFVAVEDQDVSMTQAYLRARDPELRRRRGVAVALLQYPGVLKQAIDKQRLNANDLYEPLLRSVQDAKYGDLEVKLLQTIKASERSSRNTKFLADLCLRKLQGDTLAESRRKESPQAFAESYFQYVESHPEFTLDEIEFWANPLIEEHRVRWKKSITRMKKNPQKAKRELKERQELARTLELALAASQESFAPQGDTNTSCRIQVENRPPVTIYRTAFGQWRFHNGL